jgi:hypothetical protein
MVKRKDTDTDRRSQRLLGMVPRGRSMRLRTSLFFLAWGLLAPGCSCALWQIGARNVVLAPTYGLEDKAALARDSRLSGKAWGDYCRAHPDGSYTEDFGRGFRAGYEDYLLKGEGGPPTTPPPYYLQRKYETPEGRQRIEEWIAGFAQGTAAARAGGLRHLVVQPSTGAVSEANIQRFGPPVPLTPPLPQPVGPEQAPMPAREPMPTYLPSASPGPVNHAATLAEEPKQAQTAPPAGGASADT